MSGLVTPTPFKTYPDGLPAGAGAGVRAADRPQGARQQGRLGHRDPQGAGRGAPAHRQPDRLHLGRQRLPDRGPRGPDPAGGAVPALPRGLRAGLPPVRRLPRDRASLRGPDGRGASSARPTAATSRCRRTATRCSTAWPPQAGRSSASARSRTSSPGGGCRGRSTPGPTTTAWTRPWPPCGRSTAASIFTNLVDFDTLYGHRNDVEGFARNLEALDRRMPEVLAALREDDVFVLTADHGCDPSDASTDHTREHVPVAGPRARACRPGTRAGRARRRSPTWARPWPRTSGCRRWARERASCPS